MEPYEDMLAFGGKTNSLGRANEVINSIYADPSRLDELFNCILADDAWVRMRAVDSFEKIMRDRPEWAKLYLDRVFGELTQSSQPSVQWHIAQIFCEVSLTNKQRDDAIVWLKEKIKTTYVDWIVAVNVMKALVHFHQNGFVVANELKQLCKIQEDHTSKSVRKKAASFLQSI